MADISCWVPSDRPGPVNPGTAATCQKGGEGGREGGGEEISLPVSLNRGEKKEFFFIKMK